MVNLRISFSLLQHIIESVQSAAPERNIYIFWVDMIHCTMQHNAAQCSILVLIIKNTISSIVIGLKKLLFSSKSPTKLLLNSLFSEVQ